MPRYCLSSSRSRLASKSLLLFRATTIKDVINHNKVAVLCALNCSLTRHEISCLIMLKIVSSQESPFVGASESRYGGCARTTTRRLCKFCVAQHDVSNYGVMFPQLVVFLLESRIFWVPIGIFLK
ncbi:unnamed protein product [Amoebophrya sp. A120]|nr:unnamed protein product [Amoebophrya sp. A120]|eukprot:GSA120T00006023001.1